MRRGPSWWRSSGHTHLSMKFTPFLERSSWRPRTRTRTTSKTTVTDPNETACTAARTTNGDTGTQVSECCWKHGANTLARGRAAANPVEDAPQTEGHLHTAPPHTAIMPRGGEPGMADRRAVGGCAPTGDAPAWRSHAVGLAPHTTAPRTSLSTACGHEPWAPWGRTGRGISLGVCASSTACNCLTAGPSPARVPGDS